MSSQDNNHAFSAGCLAILAASYLDNVRSPLLPVITDSLGLSYANTSLFLTLGNFAAALSIFLLVPLLRGFGERSVSIAVGVLAAMSAIYTHFVTNYSRLLFLAIVLGTSIATLGTLSNVLTLRGTSPDRRARRLSGLHVIYGLTSLTSPLIAAVFLETRLSWPWLFSLSLLVTLPFLVLSKRYLGRAGEPEHGANQATVQRSTGKSSHGLLCLVITVFSFYVAGEVLTSMWLVTYLVEFRKFSVPEGSLYLMGFFALMAATRFLCFLYCPRRLESIILWSALILPAIFMFIGHWGIAAAFSLAGCIGPFFPLFLTRISRNFPDSWRSTTVIVIGSMQLFLGIAHWGIGQLIDQLGVQKAFVAPLAFLLLAMIFLRIYFSAESRWQPEPSH